MNCRRVVITGLGCVTPAGRNVKSTWTSLMAGQSAVTYLASLEKEGCGCRIGAPVPGFERDGTPDSRARARFGRATQMALTAAEEAVANSGLQLTEALATNTGVIVGTGIGDAVGHFDQTRNYLERGVRGIQPLYSLGVMPNAPAAAISAAFGLKGVSFATSAACASSGHAVGIGARLIQTGDADVMVVGGTEDAFSNVLYVGAFDVLGALSRRNSDPKSASRPFDLDRDGFVLGEGAVILILEELAHATDRNALIYAELGGLGFSSEAHHLVVPHPEGTGLFQAMRLALEEAQCDPHNVDYINAHGTSTRLNDRAEARAIRRLFRGSADSVNVSSTKSIVGHMMGASAVLGVLVAALSIHRGEIHPTINYKTRDPECDLDCVPNFSRKMIVEASLANSLGFGGHCVSIALKKFKASA